MENVKKNTWFKNSASYFIALLAIYDLWIVFDIVKLRFSNWKFVDTLFPVILVITLIGALLMLVIKSSKKEHE
ncbi:MAG: hypothetical protein US86_C0001G0048 [Candidatus Daviesbacteria bacterium GW2011_GWA2_38_24]|uniref:Uncharacterized protein n=1 Tax=Candidatus Daviesbacteria bacterium GW2011_GWA2_38_24 TaxID=1618422 RepID=A0A0G0MQE1_9BACT|nr:MAG: hypothetical protein US86_C0001G0048 [Candidatus Daviesbacteria bacterium GW2011_GWA2_38_24]OGE22797.1 MAG: hypothetical protein A2688_00900 [Candidatus Daviesbacteria bacterium RIFCSPHIGHO2_01_FULL_38_8]